MDTDLSFLSFLKVCRTDVAHRRMTSRRVVEPLDVIKDVGPGLLPGPVHLSGRSLCLQKTEEALHGGVVPDLAGPAHAAGNALVLEQLLEVLANVLAPLVRVMQHSGRLSPAPDGHHKRVDHQLRGHAVLHRPTDDATRVQRFFTKLRRRQP